jgi:hypothetical protein
VAEDLRTGLDGLQADMASHQTRFRGEVSGEANRVLAASAIERLDQQIADEAGRIQPKPPEVVAPPVEKGAEVRDVEDKRYVISKSPSDDVKFRGASAAEAWFMAHAMERVNLLMTKMETGPLGEASWYTKTTGVMDIKRESIDSHSTSRMALARGDLSAASMWESRAEQLDRMFFVKLMQLLEESCRVFGDWKADAPKRIQVG